MFRSNTEHNEVASDGYSSTYVYILFGYATLLVSSLYFKRAAGQACNPRGFPEEVASGIIHAIGRCIIWKGSPVASIIFTNKIRLSQNQGFELVD